MHRLTNTLRTLEDTHAVLQQTELLAGVINEQDCRDIRTACCCIRSLRIRVEARANVTEREVTSRQSQLMHASVQHCPTEDLNTDYPTASNAVGCNTCQVDRSSCSTLASLHPCSQVFFSLEFGRCRSEARFLHEHKL